MNRNTILFSLPVLSLVSLLGVACTDNSTTTDDTPLEPSRDGRISSLASDACDHYADTGAGCPGYGTGSTQKYATESDCKAAFTKRAADLWPAAQCTDRRIDSANFQRCDDRAKTFACSTGFSSIFDALSALDECKASAVCTDPAQ